MRQRNGILILKSYRIFHVPLFLRDLKLITPPRLFINNLPEEVEFVEESNSVCLLRPIWPEDLLFPFYLFLLRHKYDDLLPPGPPGPLFPSFWPLVETSESIHKIRAFTENGYIESSSTRTSNKNYFKHCSNSVDSFNTLIFNIFSEIKRKKQNAKLGNQLEQTIYIQRKYKNNDINKKL